MHLAFSLAGALGFLASVSHAQTSVVKLPQGTLTQIQGTVTPVDIAGPFREGITRIERPNPIIQFSENEHAGDQPAGPRPVAALPGPVTLTNNGGGLSIIDIVKQLPAGTQPSGPPGETLLRDKKKQTPQAAASWQASANGDGLIDPEIAVSHSAVGVLTWDTLAFYNKAGKLLPASSKFPNPTNTETLFAPLLPTIDAALHLNAQVKGKAAFTMEQGQVGDARIAFDRFRNRWVVAGTAKNNGSGTDSFSARLKATQRRTKIIVAVSRDEDPSKGWNIYFFNGTPNDGACDSTDGNNSCPGTVFTPGYAGDYPSLGISSRHYIVSVHVGHYPPNGDPNTELFGYMVILNADDLANGVSHPRAHARWDWDLGNGAGNIAGVSMPVVKQNKLPVGEDWGLVVATQNNKIALTGIEAADPPNIVSVALDLPNQQGPPVWPMKGSKLKVNYGNVGNEPISAMLVGSKLITAFNDCRVWESSQSSCSPSIHIVKMEIALFPLVAIVTDRVIGLRNVFDDNQKTVFGYGMPGIGLTGAGDIVLGYSRTSTDIFPEMRASVWKHGEPDIWPSRLVRKGDATIPCSDCATPIRTDTGGASSDPADPNSIWLAHLYAGSNGRFAIWVAKVTP
ncbi:MAG TPA: hypothetical protein VFA65_08395 [Bryobacteraceae bacterium]|nr:hypothetical protein [Bryobacteraceae bacterium]